MILSRTLCGIGKAPYDRWVPKFRRNTLLLSSGRTESLARVATLHLPHKKKYSLRKCLEEFFYAC